MGLAPNRSTTFAGDSATCEVPAPIYFTAFRMYSLHDQYLCADSNPAFCRNASHLRASAWHFKLSNSVIDAVQANPR